MNLIKMKSALNALTASIKSKAASVRAESFEADNANKLQGYTLTGLETELDTVLTSHRNNKNNPHQETAASVGIPTKSAVDSALNRLLPTGVIPISRYGSFTYLPVGVSGSFESGSLINAPSFARLPMLMEEDGTLVGLRNATDGGSRGAYYFYLENARTANLNNLVLTNRRYRPAFIPGDMYVDRVYYGSDGVFTGEVTKYEDPNYRQLFVAFTNGTMDESLHTGALVPINVINPASSLVPASWEPILYNGDVYFILMASGISSIATPNFTVAKMSVQELMSGTLTMVPTLMDWTVTGVHGGPTQMANIALAPRLSSNNPDLPAMFQFSSVGVDSVNFGVFSGGAITKSQLDPNTGKVRVWSWAGARQRLISNLSTQTRDYSYSFVIDLVNKTVVLDEPYRGGSFIGFNESGNLYSSNPHYFKSLGGVLGSTGYSTRTKYLTKDGYWFIVDLADNSAGSRAFRRARLSNFDTPFDAIPSELTVTINTQSVEILSKSPTPVGSGYRGVSILKKGYLKLVTRGDGVFKNVVAKYRDDGETPEFIYRSATGPAIIGFSPKLQRSVSPFGGNDSSSSLVEFDSNNEITSIRVGSLFTGRESRPMFFTDDGALTGATLSIAPNLLESKLSEVCTAAGFTTPKRVLSGQLFVPVDVSAPVVIAAYMIDTDGTQRMALYTCTINARIGNITNLTLGVRIDTRTFGKTSSTTPSFWSTTEPFSTIYKKYPEGWGVIISGIGRIIEPGDSYHPVWKFFYNNNNTVEGLVYQSAVPSRPTTHPFVVEGLGYGTLFYTSVDTSYSTNLIFRPYGNTKANFVSGTDPGRDGSHVVLSQQVPTGWVVYFTDDTPLFMAGNSHVIPQTTIDLGDITPNPANKKFFVYVKLVGGVPRYEIRETELGESETVMYIGYIRTDEMSILEFVIDKVDRVGTFRISTKGVGSAIPVSTGHPMNPEKLIWS